MIQLKKLKENVDSFLFNQSLLKSMVKLLITLWKIEEAKFIFYRKKIRNNVEYYKLLIFHLLLFCIEKLFTSLIKMQTFQLTYTRAPTRLSHNKENMQTQNLELPKRSSSLQN